MKFNFLIFLTIMLSSCASKYPMRISINDYEEGMAITNSHVQSEIASRDICIEFDGKIPQVIPLVEKTDGQVLYNYNRNDFLSIYNPKNICDTEKPLVLKEIKNIFHWDGIKRLNLYEAEVSLDAIYECKGELRKFSSLKKRKLRKHGKLITLGGVGKEKTKAMIAAVVVLAFDAAVTDIYNQVDQHCR